jgi:NAD(P)-dependent dehydrogenase (short-subunit alcohol dehydrogenase family)
MDSQSKVVVITGASQGIGAGLVDGFLARGYRVVANSRSIAERPESKPGSGPPADNVVGVAGDIADPAVAERVIARAVEAFGRVDTLVNNAGIFISKPFTEYTAADFTRKTSVNLAGFFYVTQQAVRQMLKQPLLKQDGGDFGSRGHIVQITTTLVGQPVKGVPSALASLTKGGLDAVTRSLAIEYADHQIRFNAVAPGVIKTPMNPPETHAALAGLHPLGRMGETSEIVDAVLYLESAQFVTGETLHVDGGAHAGR